MMSLPQFSSFLLTCLSVLPLVAVASSVNTSRPNIVVILTDDMAYNALSYTGNQEVQTPNIDRIFEQGIFCNQAYVTHGVCAPSRAGLMTGRYQARYGYETLSGPTEHAIAENHGVDVNEITIADLLKQAGYTSAAYGKWHLGVNQHYQPLQRGFDRHYGFAGGGGPYYPQSNRPHGLVLNGEPATWPKDAEGMDRYQTDFLAEDAIEFMQTASEQEQPFFVYFSPYSVHAPFHARRDWKPKGRHPMAGMMEALDDNVGRILDAIDTLGISEETLIVFLNDNGGIPKLFEHGFTNAPFRGGKAVVLDGGVHVPFAWYWPGKIEGGEYNGIISSLDLLPSFAALAGVPLPSDREYDGKNVLPHLTGKVAPDTSRTLCWRWRNGHAVRKGKWKLVWELNWGEFHRLREAQGLDNPSPTARPNPEDRFSTMYFEPKLYDLSVDPGETKDLTTQFPEIVQNLKQELVAFDAIAKPLSDKERNAWPRPSTTH